jgi:NADH-quinone oxidoreductase subunit E
MSAAPDSRRPERLLSDDARRRIDRELGKFPPDQKQSAVMAALAIAQDEAGWVSQALVEEVAGYLDMQPIAVWEVATFYNMYNLRPPGAFRLSVCTNLPCALRDGARAGEYLKSKLGVDYGGTTADGLFTLVEAECLGACGDAPVLLVNNKRMCSFMSEDRLDALIDELKSRA